MKFDSSDVIKILRLFISVSDDSFARDIKNIKKIKPHETNALITFKYKKDRYGILIDNLAQDDTESLYFQAAQGGLDDEFKLLPNPDGEKMTTYAVPYKGKDCYLFIKDRPVERLDVLMSEKNPEYSRSYCSKLIEKGLVFIDGEKATKSSQNVNPNQEIVIKNEEVEDFDTSKIDILYEDENVLVIDKPEGLLTHKKRVEDLEFSASVLVKDKTDFRIDTNRPGIVHRLDKYTSGVLLMVKNTKTADYIQEQFSKRTTKKTYVALINGVPKNNQAIIDLPIERNPAKPSTFRVGVNGKEALTQYKVEKTLNNISMINLMQKTGRTHQLRVHMAYINTPIVGDKVYNKKSKNEKRMYLHANKLEITLPNGDRKEFVANIPKKFTERFNED